MDSIAIQKEITVLERSLKREKGIRFSLVAVVAVLAFAFISKSSETIVVMQPIGTENKEMRVSSNSVSKEYLISVTEKIIDFAFVYSPSTVEHRFSQLLNTVHPADYGVMQKFIASEKERVLKGGISTVFYPKEYKIGELNKQVVVSGNMITLSGAKIVAQENKSIRFDFEVRNHFLSLVGFYDVTDMKRPFEPMKLQTTEGQPKQ